MKRKKKSEQNNDSKPAFWTHNKVSVMSVIVNISSL
jgi:hypothetical protein